MKIYVMRRAKNQHEMFSGLRRSQNFTGISIEKALLKLLNDDVGINLASSTLAIEGLTEVLATLGLVEHYGWTYIPDKGVRIQSYIQ